MHNDIYIILVFSQRHLHHHRVLEFVLHHKPGVTVEDRFYEHAFSVAAFLYEGVGVGDLAAVEGAADAQGHGLERQWTAAAVEVALGEPCLVGELHEVGHRAFPPAAAVADFEKSVEDADDARLQLTALLAEDGAVGVAADNDWVRWEMPDHCWSGNSVHDG